MVNACGRIWRLDVPRQRWRMSVNSSTSPLPLLNRTCAVSHQVASFTRTRSLRIVVSSERCSDPITNQCNFDLPHSLLQSDCKLLASHPDETNADARSQGMPVACGATDMRRGFNSLSAS